MFKEIKIERENVGVIYRRWDERRQDVARTCVDRHEWLAGVAVNANCADNCRRIRQTASGGPITFLYPLRLHPPRLPQWSGPLHNSIVNRQSKHSFIITAHIRVAKTQSQTPSHSVTQATLKLHLLRWTSRPLNPQPSFVKSRNKKQAWGENGFKRFFYLIPDPSAKIRSLALSLPLPLWRTRDREQRVRLQLGNAGKYDGSVRSTKRHSEKAGFLRRPVWSLNREKRKPKVLLTNTNSEKQQVTLL